MPNFLIEIMSARVKTLPPFYSKWKVSETNISTDFHNKLRFSTVPGFFSSSCPGLNQSCLPAQSEKGSNHSSWVQTKTVQRFFSPETFCSRRLLVEAFCDESIFLGDVWDVLWQGYCVVQIRSRFGPRDVSRHLTCSTVRETFHDRRRLTYCAEMFRALRRLMF